MPAPPAPPRRTRGRPRDPEADGRILAAASALILMRGFESMTVDEVASNLEAGDDYHPADGERRANG